MKLDCVRGAELGLKPKWVVVDTVSQTIWGTTYHSSDLAWVEAADRLSRCVSASGCDVANYAIPRERLQ